MAKQYVKHGDILSGRKHNICNVLQRTKDKIFYDKCETIWVANSLLKSLLKTVNFEISIDILEQDQSPSIQ